MAETIGLYELAVARTMPPVSTLYHLIMPEEGTADIVTTPEPQTEPDVVDRTVGKVFTVATIGNLLMAEHPFTPAMST